LLQRQKTARGISFRKFRGDSKALLGLTFALRGLHPTKPKVVRLASKEPPSKGEILLMTKRSTCRTMALPSPKSGATSLQACSTSTPSATKGRQHRPERRAGCHIPASRPRVHLRTSASSNKAPLKTIFGGVPSTSRSIRTHSPSSAICFAPKCDEKSAFEGYHLQE